MRTNYAVQTRMFNRLKSEIRAQYDESVFMNDTAVVRWNQECCIAAHDGSLGFSIYFENEAGEIETIVEIIWVRHLGDTHRLQGIHLRETDVNHLQDAIDTALKDGFEKIYVHSVAKKGGAR